MHILNLCKRFSAKHIDAKSVLMVLTMGIRQDEQLTIIADGPDEIESIEALRDLIEKLD